MKTKKFALSVLSVVLLLCVTVLPVLALTGTVTTNSDPLRVRTGPGTGYELLYQNGQVVQLPKGTAVSVLGTYQSDKGDTTNYPVWYKITATFNGASVTGYVSAKYITLDPEPATPPVSGGDIDIYAVPEAYRPYLKPLMEAHPNWKFTFVDTGLDWNEVMDNECYRGAPFRNVVSASLKEEYRYKDANGNYLDSGESGGGKWYQASDEVVAYYMDPRNLMTENRIFQFELQGFNENLQTVAGVESIIKGSFMENAYITADDGRSLTYAQAIYEAGQKSGASPYFLASKIIQEVSRNGSGSTSGTYIAKDGTNLSGYYNYYNIQATAGADPVKYGLVWASQEGGSFGRPWTSPYKSIVGGAQWIANGYINQGQNTNYLQKFDVESEHKGLYWHQYMGNVVAACSEANIAYKGYVNNGMLNNDFVFVIPLYENLPEQRCRLPWDTSVDPAPIPDPIPTPDPEPTPTPDPEPTPTPDPDPTPTPDPEPTEPPAKGDLNGDKKVTAVDARYVLQIATGARAADANQLAQGDVNGDGKINATDARWILQMASGARAIPTV